MAKVAKGKIKGHWPTWPIKVAKVANMSKADKVTDVSTMYPASVGYAGLDA